MCDEQIWQLVPTVGITGQKQTPHKSASSAEKKMHITVSCGAQGVENAQAHTHMDMAATNMYVRHMACMHRHTYMCTLSHVHGVHNLMYSKNTPVSHSAVSETNLVLLSDPKGISMRVG